MKREDIHNFIENLDQEHQFFNGIDEINQYNVNAIAELIQYYNMKIYKDPIYKKSEIRQAIKTYFASCR
ncbi:hypothetical protein [Alkaliphilus oremlandii]|uniref:Uncharacterized protein n=1 Tax=Alkaliphilus oremlandii (strain OhILAs) TaxID=350688 RepID=A8MIN4_ALKOO|nr:hypothetical protein [Alkaliphilus oremlandii]ABW19666.1 hypothetical protein Clos_2130 [Alkaliphilus oremlandii OhILAs]